MHLSLYEMSWRDRFDVLKLEHDKALIELLELNQKYNSLIDDYNQLKEKITKPIAKGYECRKICTLFDIRRSYEYGDKYCSHCEHGIPEEHFVCPCCRLRLRVVPRDKR